MSGKRCSATGCNFGLRSWGGHMLHQCDGRVCRWNEGYPCCYCDGGLALCHTCGGAEGSLPDVCPGFRMSEAEQDDVYHRGMEWADGAWRGGPATRRRLILHCEEVDAISDDGESAGA